MRIVRLAVRTITIGCQYGALFILTATLLHVWFSNTDRITFNFNTIGEQAFETIAFAAATVLSLAQLAYKIYRKLVK